MFGAPVKSAIDVPSLMLFAKTRSADAKEKSLPVFCG
jgi:hypothetical protein